MKFTSLFTKTKPNYSLKFHQQFHMSQCRPKVCLICEEIFTDDILFVKHLEFTHESNHNDCFSQPIETFIEPIPIRKSIKRKFNENNSSKPKNNVKLMKNHNDDNFNLNAYECDICDKKFAIKQGLKSHIRVHIKQPKIKLFICQHCDQAFEQNINALNHIKQLNSPHIINISKFLTNRIFICEFCDVKYIKFSQLSAHRKLHEIETNPFQCVYCREKLPNHNSFENHKLIQHSIEMDDDAKTKQNHSLSLIDQIYICTERGCKKSFRTLMNLIEHKYQHKQTNELYKCSICKNIEFDEQRKYSYHMLSYHSDEIKLYTCDKCDKTMRRGEFLNHYATFHLNASREDEIKFKNQIKKTAQRTEEYKKYITKTDTFRYYCKACEISLSSQTAARVHVRYSHMNERSFSCDLCEKQFFSSALLRRHMGTRHKHVNIFSPFFNIIKFSFISL